MTVESNIFMFRFNDGEVFMPPCRRFEIIESISDGIRWKLDIDFLNWETFGDLVDGNTDYFQHFDFKFGDHVVDSTSDKNWYHGVVLKAIQNTNYDGAKIQIIGGDKGLWMKARSRSQLWKFPFSTIVSNIASEYGLDASVESPSNETPPHNYWQYGDNDWSFLDGWRKLFISSERGLSDYSMWIEKGKTLKFQPPGRNRIPSKVWSYGGKGSVIKNIRFIQRKQALQMFGGLSVRATSFDINSKRFMSVDRNYTDYPENSALGPRVSLPNGFENPSVIYSTSSSSEAELSNRAAANIGSKHRKMYVAVIDIFPDMDGYEVGDIINISMSRSGSGTNDNTFSGNYIVEKRRSVYKQNFVSMQLLLYRVGSNIGEQDVPGVAMDNAPVEVVRGNGRDRGVTKI